MSVTTQSSECRAGGRGQHGDRFHSSVSCSSRAEGSAFADFGRVNVLHKPQGDVRMTRLNSVTIAMSKELKAFVQMLLAEEYRIGQINSFQASESNSVAGSEASVKD